MHIHIKGDAKIQLLFRFPKNIDRKVCIKTFFSFFYTFF